MITITEALREIKTINGRLEKKRAGLMPYVARDSRVRDPFESSGGSIKFIKEERQSLNDLENRIVSIRTAIQRSNLNSPMTVNNKTRSVAEWLTWRREVATGSAAHLNAMVNGIRQVRTQAQQKGGKVTAVASAEINYNADAPPEIVVSADERALMVELDEMQQILGVLDGKLSLFNATTTIDV